MLGTATTTASLSTGWGLWHRRGTGYHWIRLAVAETEKAAVDDMFRCQQTIRPGDWIVTDSDPNRPRRRF